MILQEIEKSGQNIRLPYQRRLPSNTAKDYYFIHRDTGEYTQPLMILYGYSDSSSDDPEQLKENYDIYAEAVVKAIMQYIGGIYTLPGGMISGTRYIVNKGDSLWNIAQKFGTTVSALRDINNLSSDTLQIGQILLIPVSSTTNQTSYTVKSGDSLWGIAQKFDTTVDAIKATNNLTSNLLQIGQVLIIPMSSKQEENQDILYTVKSGDSLYKIANQYNTTVSELMRYNNLTSNLLSIGQVLRIPQTSSSATTYVVRSGDSLWSIANKFNTTVDELKRKNNLTSNLLNIGQILKI